MSSYIFSRLNVLSLLTPHHVKHEYNLSCAHVSHIKRTPSFRRFVRPLLLSHLKVIDYARALLLS